MKHIDEYELQAINFLADTNTRLEISFVEKVTKWGGYRWKYYCKLRRGHKTYSFPFYDSIANYKSGKRPTKYDVLACLDTYDYIRNINEFADEFCYDIDNDYKETEKIYKACMKQSEKLHGLFDDEELEMLNDIR